MRSTLFKVGGLILFMAASSAAFGQCTVPPCSNIDKQVMGSRWPAFGIDSGAANAYAVTTTAALGPSLRTGSKIMFFATHANTTASTLAVNGGSAIAVKKNVSIALASGDILLNGLVEVVYDGTNFQMVGNGVFSGSVSCSQLPAFTGDTTTSAGSCATTTVKVNGVSYPASPSTNTIPVVTGSNTVTYETAPVAAGGTGAATLAAHGVVVGNTTSAVNVTGAGTSGQCLTSNGASSDPTYQTCGGGGGGTTPALMQYNQKHGQNFDSFSGGSGSGNVTSGNFLVAAFNSSDGSVDPLTVTDSRCTGNWLLGVKSTSNANKQWVYYCKATSSGTDTVTSNMACPFCEIQIFEFAGDINAVVDGTGTSYASTGSPTTTVATTQTHDFIFSTVGGFHSNNAFTAVSPMTFIDYVNGADALGSGFTQATGAGSYTSGFNVTAGLTDNVVMASVAFTTSRSVPTFNQTIQVDGSGFAQEPITDFISGTGITLAGADDSANTRTKVTINRDALTGDVTTSGDAATLASVVTADSCGDSTHSCGLTYDAKGRITAASNNAISGSGGGGALTKICSLTASSSTSLDFTAANCGALPFTSTYDEYVIKFKSLVFNTNSVQVNLLVSTDGTTFITSGYLSSSLYIQQSTTVNGGINATNAILLQNAFGTGTTRAIFGGTVNVHDPLNASLNKLFEVHTISAGNDGNFYSFNGGGVYNSASAVTAFSIKPSSGNITSGRVTIYGYQQ